MRICWRGRKRTHLTLEVYRLTRNYPADERFGLTSQTRRSVSSVPGNVAEGCGKRTKPQLRHHVDIACGSLSELEYWLLLAHDLGYLETDAFTAINADLNEVRRLLLGFAAWSEAETQATSPADEASS